MRHDRIGSLPAVVALILIILSGSSALADQNLPAFMDSLFYAVAQDYCPVGGDQFAAACNELEIKPGSDSNKVLFFKLFFLHDLMTTTAASNCATGGILRIPYFWHWVKPNPRHSIYMMPDSVLLTSLTPPAEFGQYKTYADIDRLPTLYLADMVTEEPKYCHPDCGRFFTFGWCSEREMAFSTLATLMGFDCKIKQSGIHTWSCILINFAGAAQDSVAAELMIDNTFDMFQWNVVGNVAESSWASDIGRGTDIKWYNDIIGSREKLARVSKINVTSKAAARIEAAVREFLSSR